MNQIYRAIGSSRQSFHQKLDRKLRFLDEQEQMYKVVWQIRQDHPKMSSRQIYRLVQPQSMGRDKFEKWCHSLGFKVKSKASKRKTTNSLGVTRFNNLIKGKELTGVNQVWVSDITYFRIKDEFYYLTFILDQYSRRIIGYAVSDNLHTTNTTIKALNKALKLRSKESLADLIFHSDGGGQYYSKDFIRITRHYGIRNSMAESVYENPHAERINGTIKNDYLKPYKPTSLEELKRTTLKAVNMYNDQRPHKAINGLSPKTFESTLLIN